MQTKLITVVSVLIITLGGFLIRIHAVGINPAGFFCDEASIGYNAYTLSTLGTDEYGKRLPIFFQSFGEYRPPIPFYAAVPFVTVLGLTETAVRAATATVGTLTIPVLALFTYLLVSSVTRHPRAASVSAVFSSFLLAISPWHIQMSRFGSEYVYLPFFVLLTVTMFLVAWKRPANLPVAAVFCALVGYTYLPGVVIGPLLFLGLILIGFRHFRSRTAIACISVAAYLIILIPMGLALANGTLLTRWNKVGLSNAKEPARGAETFLRSYAAHFSPQFLFTTGDIDYPGHFIRRYSVRGLGELYFPDALFLLIGLTYTGSCIVRKKTVAWIPVLLIALYPVGSSITTTDGGGPLAFRSVLGSVVFPILSAIGVSAVLTAIKKPAFRLGLGILVTSVYLLLFSNYLNLYYRQYPLYSQDFWGWQFGPRDIMRYFLAHRQEYDQLMIIGDFNAPNIFIRFYDPQNLCTGKCTVGDVKKITADGTQLVALGAPYLDKVPLKYFETKHTIYYPNKSPAFVIGIFRVPVPERPENRSIQL